MALVVVPAAAQAPPPAETPTVITGPVTNVTSSGWTANATVNAKGRTVDVRFQVGLFSDFRRDGNAGAKAFEFAFPTRLLCRQDTARIDGGSQPEQPEVPASCAYKHDVGEDAFLKAAAVVDGLSTIYYRAIAVWNDGTQNPGQNYPEPIPTDPPGSQNGTRFVLGEVRSFEIPDLPPGGICANTDVIPEGRLNIVFDLLVARCGGGTPAKALLTALTPIGPAAKLGAILEAGAYPATFFAPGGGSAKIVWTVRAAAKTKPVVVASGSTSGREARVTVIKVRLTKKGKALFRKSKVKITATGSFASEGEKTTKVKRFTLKR